MGAGNSLDLALRGFGKTLSEGHGGGCGAIGGEIELHLPPLFFFTPSRRANNHGLVDRTCPCMKRRDVGMQGGRDKANTSIVIVELSRAEGYGDRQWYAKKTRLPSTT